MKLSSAMFLTLWLAFSRLPTLVAQDDSSAAAAETEQCVQWMKATVPESSTKELDPADFCSGISNGHTGGWGAIQVCGQPAEADAGKPATNYCTSSGSITQYEAWAAGFISTTGDGRELLNGTSGAGVTFYSRTPVWMGGLKVPAGMYKLVPSRSSHGWTLSVAGQDGAWNDPQGVKPSLGSVAMKTATRDSASGKNLVISIKFWADGCPGPAMDAAVRELHFGSGSTDVFVCLKPDQVLKQQAGETSQR